MVCSNCARIIRTEGRVPEHYKKNRSGNIATCPEPGGGKYAEMIRKQRLAELPKKYRETKRKLGEAYETIGKLEKDLDRERKRIHIPAESECPICYDHIKECGDTDSVGFITLKCGHLICAPCYNTMISRYINPILRRSANQDPLHCPMCRTVIARVR